MNKFVLTEYSLVRNSGNATFPQSQKSHYARTWCTLLLKSCQFFDHLIKNVRWSTIFYEKVLFSTQLSSHLMRKLLKNSEMVPSVHGVSICLFLQRCCCDLPCKPGYLVICIRIHGISIWEFAFHTSPKLWLFKPWR